MDLITSIGNQMGTDIVESKKGVKHLKPTVAALNVTFK